MLDRRFAFASLSSLLVALMLGAALAGAEQMDVPAEGYRAAEVDSCEGVDIGNADGSTAEPTVDLDDVVYLIAFIFSSGPFPTPYVVISGDGNCSCAVDIDDVVYLIAYIFSGGAPPACICEEWIEICGPLH
jgi:hypothetical protein